MTYEELVERARAAAKKTEKVKTIHTTTTQVHNIEKDGFEVVCDSNGNILTDMGLLKIIRRWRFEKAKEIKKPAYIILSNASLVDLATRQPLTREELLSIYGIGEKKVEQFGDEIIQIIKEHNNPEFTTNAYHWGTDWPEFR